MKRKSLLLMALVVITLAAWAPVSTDACTFCNLTGYSSCDSLQGTACYSPGTSQRCYVEPACSCEWGRCRCDEATGTWNCIW